jgi:hypothetical protein
VLDRLVLGVALSVVGCNGLFPEPSIPLTLKEKAKMQSVGKVCMKKNKQTVTVKQLCKRWEVQKNA